MCVVVVQRVLGLVLSYGLGFIGCGKNRSNLSIVANEYESNPWLEKNIGETRQGRVEKKGASTSET
jgi:hypothetical protein